jgi:hypothetical protein
VDVFSAEVADAVQQAGPGFIEREVEQAVEWLPVHSLALQVGVVDTQEQPLT